MYTAFIYPVESGQENDTILAFATQHDMLTFFFFSQNKTSLQKPNIFYMSLTCLIQQFLREYQTASSQILLRFPEKWKQKPKKQ